MQTCPRMTRKTSDSCRSPCSSTSSCCWPRSRLPAPASWTAPSPRIALAAVSRSPRQRPGDSACAARAAPAPLPRPPGREARPGRGGCGAARGVGRSAVVGRGLLRRVRRTAHARRAHPSSAEPAAQRPWQRLNFWPEPHGQGSLRPTSAPPKAGLERRQRRGRRRRAEPGSRAERTASSSRRSSSSSVSTSSDGLGLDRPRRGARHEPETLQQRVALVLRQAVGVDRDVHARGCDQPEALPALTRGLVRPEASCCRNARRAGEPPESASRAAVSSNGSHAAQPVSIRLMPGSLAF